jgi:CRP-like cAMP-binding protein
MDITILQNMPLFRGMTDKEISALLKSLDGRKQNYEKNEIILHAGSKPGVIGLVLSGSVTILSDDIWGNRTILSHVEKGGLFAEAYALLEDVPMLVDVMANEGCSILMLKTKGILSSAKSQNSWDYKFLRNLLLISSRKNLNLSGRSFHTSPKTIRERVMSYLNTLALQNDSTEFDIPFDRQQLADYLNLERSALSKELGRMQKEGLIVTKKSHFKLLTH